MDAREQRLQTWPKIWALIFAAGGLGLRKAAERPPAAVTGH